MREFPNQGERVETGPVQFGDDWPGVFIRGDHALWWSQMIDLALSGRADELQKASLRSLSRTLRQCRADAIEARQQ